MPQCGMDGSGEGMARYFRTDNVYWVDFGIRLAVPVRSARIFAFRPPDKVGRVSAENGADSQEGVQLDVLDLPRLPETDGNLGNPTKPSQLFLGKPVGYPKLLDSVSHCFHQFIVYDRLGFIVDS